MLLHISRANAQLSVRLPEGVSSAVLRFADP
jgi:hypothetical protein